MGATLHPLDHIPFTCTRSGQCTRRKLDHGSRLQHHPGQPPRRQLRVDGDDFLLPIEEHHIDTKPHKERVDGVTRLDDQTLTLRQPWFQTGKRFNYPGRKLDAVFTKLDATITDELGNDGEGNTNFVHLQAGKGHIYLHLAPLAFSNYFLLRGNNMEYFEQVMSVVQPGVRKIFWDEYFINKKNQENNRSKKSWLTVLSRYPGLKAALLTAIFTLLLYLLLEMRRKQRFIPVVTKPRNDSLDFVKTIGRLYYDRSDHQNLCRKMATYFLEHIRSRYKLPTGNLDETFIRNLQFKTGVEEQEIRGIVTFIRYIEDAPAVAAADVHAFHQQLESFYKKA